MTVRIIPRLDVKGPNLVKGIHLEGLRILGPIEAFAEYYYDNGADELLYVDAVASLYGRNSLVDIIKLTSSKIFIPLCVGGGLRSIGDIATVLRAGADKVAINTAAIQRPELIREASKIFGSSTIVVSIQAVKRPNGQYECFIDNGRESTGINVHEWAKKVEELGAGEILLTSVDKEGTGQGYDCELINMIALDVDIPVVAGGGAGSKEHVVDSVIKGRADAVCMASILHYDTVQKIEVGDINELAFGATAERRNAAARIKSTTLSDVKNYLRESEIDVRY
mgnify:CR=1 FL=1